MAESLLSHDDALCSSQDRKFLRTDATEMPMAHRGEYIPRNAYRFIMFENVLTIADRMAWKIIRFTVQLYLR